jgi:DNA-binding transcriptional regulator LsrR (DeoR family)
MQRLGAAGEVAGWVYDSTGRYMDFGINNRTGGVRVEPGRDAMVIGIAAGSAKVGAIRAALSGNILNGLITDETTAEALLRD